jgi:hypothetical protein
MNEETSLPLADPDKLRQNLDSEYQALMKVVSNFDARLVTVKGWSVTLSLAGLGLGFQSGHYALFALGILTAISFWTIEANMKRHQMRYYPRMREIEVISYHLNRVRLPEGRDASSPLVDWSWMYPGYELSGIPERLHTEEFVKSSRRAPWVPWVFLPHALAVVVGTILLLLVFTGVPGFGQLQP